MPRGRNEWEAECLVCKLGTYISVSCKGSADLKSRLRLDKHGRAARGTPVSRKVTKHLPHHGVKQKMR